MAEKRMFSLKIVDSDLFLDMPLSSQCLYFHLSMRADDDGFVDNPKKIIKIIGANEDDLKILITKGFVITFDKGIIVITHWKLNNYIRSDRRKETIYIEEKQALMQSQNGAYIKVNTFGIPTDNKMATTCLPSIDKDRLDKISLDKESIVAPPFTALYGEYQNVCLTDDEYNGLKDKLQDHTNIMIDKLSRYIKSTGKKYQSHYATILNWYEQDKDKLSNKLVGKAISTDYEDSESL